MRVCCSPSGLGRSLPSRRRSRSVLLSAAEPIIDDAIDHWGSCPDAFPSEIRTAYVNALRDPAHVHAICEEYRAAATLDREHDALDLAAGRRMGQNRSINRSLWPRLLPHRVSRPWLR
jgi:hypothetical protein